MTRFGAALASENSGFIEESRAEDEAVEALVVGLEILDGAPGDADVHGRARATAGAMRRISLGSKGLGMSALGPKAGVSPP